MRSVLLALPLLLLPTIALAADDEATSDDKHDSDNVRGISFFMEEVAAGNAKLIGHDVSGAITQYRKAEVLAPKNPLGPYVLAEALIVKGNLEDAHGALGQGDELSFSTPDVRAKVLFRKALLLEQEKKWAEAKAAWQACVDYGTARPEVGAPGAAAVRVRAVDAKMSLDKAYEVVRQRIAAEKAEAQQSAAPAAAVKKR